MKKLACLVVVVVLLVSWAQSNKPDSGKRSHRGGAGAGMAGSMPQN